MSRAEVIVECLEGAYLPISVSTIAEATNIPVSTIRGIVRRMRKRGELWRTRGCKGTRLYELVTPEKEEYRAKKQKAADQLDYKKANGPKLFELLKRAKATVKTPGLIEEIETILGGVENV